MYLSSFAPLLASVVLAVNPSVVKTNSAWTVDVTGLQPEQAVTFTLESAAADDGARFRSTVDARADGKGEVHLADPMRMLQLLRWQGTAESDWRLLSHLELKASVDGEAVAQQGIDRFRCGSQRDVAYETVVTNGLDGVYIKPAGRPAIGKVLVLSGSGGGMDTFQACELARQGYAAFALAYFKQGQLPETLVRIPLEYLERGIDWLRAKDWETQAVAVWGASRGGELALLLGATFPAKVQGVIAVVPSGLVWAGLPGDGSSVAAWSYRGQDVAYVPSRSEGCVDTRHPPYALRPRFECSIRRADSAELEAATIPVENMSGPLLLISGGDDQLWPSDTFSAMVEARLAGRNFPHSVTHLRYPDTGHSLFPPYWPTTESRIYGNWIMGGTAEGYAFASVDSFRRTLQFLGELGDNASIPH